MSATQEELIAALRKVAEAARRHEDPSHSVLEALKELAELESVLPSRKELEGPIGYVTSQHAESVGAYWLRWAADELVGETCVVYGAREQLDAWAKELEKRASE